MISTKSCFVELGLGLAMLAVVGALAWVIVTVPGVAGAPICLYSMMIVTALGLVVVASKVRQSEKGVIEAGDIAESQGGDPIAPVTRTARSGCGTGIAMLGILAVCGILAGIAAAMAGGL